MNHSLGVFVTRIAGKLNFVHISCSYQGSSKKICSLSAFSVARVNAVNGREEKSLNALSLAEAQSI